MNRKDFLYTNEATVLTTKNDVCIVHQVMAPNMVTVDNIEALRGLSGDNSLAVGTFIGLKEDVVTVFMTQEHARKLIDALESGLKKIEAKAIEGETDGSTPKL